MNPEFFSLSVNVFMYYLLRGEPVPQSTIETVAAIQHENNA